MKRSDGLVWLFEAFAPGWEIWFDRKSARWFARQPKLLILVNAADSFELVRLIRCAEEHWPPE